MPRVINPIEEILERPTVYKDIHQSVFRASAILDYVMVLVERGTPPKVIKELVEYLKDAPAIDQNIKSYEPYGEYSPPISVELKDKSESK